MSDFHGMRTVGPVRAGEFVSRGVDLVLAEVDATAGNVVLNVAQVFNGVLLVDTAAAPRNATTPAAADIVAGFGPEPEMGYTVMLYIRNTGTEALTVVAGDDVAIIGDPVIPVDQGTQFMVVIAANGVAFLGLGPVAY